MDVGMLVRSLLGNTRPSSAKALELKVGQVVKGVVMQLLSESEALLQIEGMPVRARLQTPLNPGQSTLLQVQPESENGYIVFKPLEQSQMPLQKQSLEQILKAWSLPVDGKHKQLLQLMRENQMPLEKNTAKQLLTVMSSLPKGMPAQQTVQTAALMLQKGLPLTGESLQAVHQIRFGEPMQQLLKQMTSELEQYVQSERTSTAQAAGGSAAGSTASEVPARLLQLLKGLSVLQNRIAHSDQASTTQPSGAAVPSNSNAEGHAQAGGVKMAAAGTESARTGFNSNPPSAAVVSPPGGAAPGAGAPHQLNHVPSAEIRSGELTANGQGQDKRASLNQTSNQVASSQQSASEAGRSAQAVAAKGGEAVHTGVSTSPSGEHELLKWFKQLGVHHERDSWKLLLRTMADTLPYEQNRDGLEFQRMKAGESQAGEAGGRGVQETVKSLLLQLAQLEELPHSLKESSSQLLQHITGQQLMMGQERGTMLSHMTFILPSGPQQEGKDISVTVQARRGSKGEIDANNCRLLFDLQLASLGNTMIDVQVTNQVVQLRVLNDEPGLEEWMQDNGAELKEGMKALGFLLSGMHQAPYPVSEGQAVAASQEEMNDSFILGQVHRKLAPPEYRGVDIRL
ncbi:hypothetical protein [Marinicrinis lubricantis]|uniref:Flagellar hook-length control protein FliK n=1 Tax=Marinicrinis lubricantis TaxID=2086470 RepID=A0ABW1IMM4_9BACL